MASDFEVVVSGAGAAGLMCAMRAGPLPTRLGTLPKAWVVKPAGTEGVAKAEVTRGGHNANGPGRAAGPRARRLEGYAVPLELPLPRASGPLEPMS
jgi:hypothetical protein